MAQKSLRIWNYVKNYDSILAYMSTKKALSAQNFKIQQTNPNYWQCMNLLYQNSSSFAFLINQLPSSHQINPTNSMTANRQPNLQKSVLIFYLILRALDTIEDNQLISHKMREYYCNNFYKHLTNEQTWNPMEYLQSSYLPSLKDREIKLFYQFNTILKIYRNELSTNEQSIILNIVKKMGNGMSNFINVGEIIDIDMYNQYCYIVAGLVGIGMTQLLNEYNYNVNFRSL